MDHDRLRRLIAEELTRALAAEASPHARPAPSVPGLRPALIVFSGETCPAAPLLALLDSLRRQGWALQALASISFRSRVLGPRPGAIGSLPQVGEPDNELAVARLAGQARLFIFPDLSDNALAKAALGIADSIPTRALAAALPAGAPCLLLETSPSASPLVGLARLERLRRLERRGAVLATLDDFADRLRAALAPHVPAPFAPLSGAAPAAGRPPARPVVTADDVLAAARRGQDSLRFPPNAIVTDRAREEAARLGLALLADEAAT